MFAGGGGCGGSGNGAVAGSGGGEARAHVGVGFVGVSECRGLVEVGSAELFYIVAVGAGVGMGWLQSAGRAAVAEMTPVGKEGEWFWDMGFCGKAGRDWGAVGVWGCGLRYSECVVRF